VIEHLNVQQLASLHQGAAFAGPLIDGRSSGDSSVSRRPSSMAALI